LKKLSLALALFILACVGREAYEHLAFPYSAYRVYQERATAIAKERRSEPPFAAVSGIMTDVFYRLESLDRESDNKVRIVAVQSVHFERTLAQNLGSKEVARTRQHVIMMQMEDGWEISQFEEDATELSTVKEAFEAEAR
jgi:hypothetical protein